MIPFFASAALALAFALSFKGWHKRQRRQSPLRGKKLGHLPGQQLLERIDHHDTGIMGAVMIMYFALPIMFMLWAGKELDWTRLRWGFEEIILLAGGISVFAYGLYDYIRHYRARQDAQDGLTAERVTGMQLNRLSSRGCLVMHDLPADGFNIDHVVIAPRAVYAVEAKSFRKPRNFTKGDYYRVAYDGQMLKFPDFGDKEALAQAARQAKWLKRLLRESLSWDVEVIPALALPGWHIDQTQDVWRSSGVKVFTPMGDGANFMAKDLNHLDATQRSLIAQALAIRYPVLDE